MTWLRELTGLTSLPSFEVDAFTLGVLETLMRSSREADEKASIYAAGIEKLANEYGAEAGRLSALLHDAFGWQPDGAAAGGKRGGTSWSRALTDLALELQLASACDAGFVLALAELADRRQRAAQHRAIEAEHLASLEAAAVGAAQRRLAAEMLLERLAAEEASGSRQAIVAQRRADTEFLLGKPAKYAASVATLEKRLVASGGADPAVRHERLLERAELLSAVNGRLAGVRAHLAAYSDLPPDAALARAKLEQAKSELAKLEAQLTQQIEQMRL